MEDNFFLHPSVNKHGNTYMATSIVWCSWRSGESLYNVLFLHIILETEQIAGLHYKPD